MAPSRRASLRPITSSGTESFFGRRSRYYGDVDVAPLLLALWATACKKAFWPARTFLHAYEGKPQVRNRNRNRGRPVAAKVRDIMAAQIMWSGNASDILRRSRSGLTEGLGLAELPARAGRPAPGTSML
jgi:hypothetical protein